MSDITHVRLRRPWFFKDHLYPAEVTGVTIVGLQRYADEVNAAAKKAAEENGEKAPAKKEVKDILPAGAEILTEKATPLPQTHPTVTTLSELSKRPAPSPVEAVTASKGPEVLVDDTVKEPGLSAPAKTEAKK